MSARRRLSIAALAIFCASMVACKSRDDAWQVRMEKEATADFYKNQARYNELLREWLVFNPNRCGGKAPAPGLISDKSISANGSAYAIDVDGQATANLTPGQIATRLGLPAADVTAVTDEMKRLGTPEVLQSGPAVKIISSQNDTHGILHIDETCSESASYVAWSESHEPIGPYVRLKALGHGWYYYVENR